MPFSAASFRTAGVALTSDRSGRSAVAVAEADGCGDEDADDIEGAGDEGRCGCGGTLSEGDDARAEGDVGVADEGG
jgi:hypothetical protein